MVKYSQKTHTDTHCCRFISSWRQAKVSTAALTSLAPVSILSCHVLPYPNPVFLIEKPITKFLNCIRLVATRTLSSLAIVRVRLRIPQKKNALQIPLQSNQERRRLRRWKKRRRILIHFFLRLHLNFNDNKERGERDREMQNRT